MARFLSIRPLDKVYSALPYIMPLASVSFFGAFLFYRFPFLQQVYLPFLLANRVLNHRLLDSQILSFGISIDFVLFFVLYLFVVRNYKIRHFIRFNTMQALLFGIALSLLTILIGLIVEMRVFTALLQFITSNAWLLAIFEILATTIFLSMVAACGYSIFKIIKGEYADMPIISDAANYHVRG
jgi:hypothetical protein